MGDHVEAGSKRYRIVEEHEPGGPKCVEHMAPEANDADQIATLPIDRIPIVALQVVFICESAKAALTPSPTTVRWPGSP